MFANSISKLSSETISSYNSSDVTRAVSSDAHNAGVDSYLGKHVSGSEMSEISSKTKQHLINGEIEEIINPLRKNSEMGVITLLFEGEDDVVRNVQTISFDTKDGYIIESEGVSDGYHRNKVSNMNFEDVIDVFKNGFSDEIKGIKTNLKDDALSISATNTIKNVKDKNEDPMVSFSFSEKLHVINEAYSHIDADMADDIKTLSKQWGSEDAISLMIMIERIGSDSLIGKSADDVFFHRTIKPENVKLGINESDKTIYNNKNAMADLGMPKYIQEDGKWKYTESVLPARELAGGGINFMISTSSTPNNYYHSAGDLQVRCKLSDVLNLGGRIHFDVSSHSARAVLVEMPANIGLPYEKVD